MRIKGIEIKKGGIYRVAPGKWYSHEVVVVGTNIYREVFYRTVSPYSGEPIGVESSKPAGEFAESVVSA